LGFEFPPWGGFALRESDAERSLFLHRIVLKEHSNELNYRRRREQSGEYGNERIGYWILRWGLMVITGIGTLVLGTIGNERIITR
jgi:hypothetical protein